MESTTLQFNGWHPLIAVAAALAAAATAGMFYRRETRGRAGYSRWALPVLRSLAVFLTLMALSAPVLHREKIIRNLGRLFVFVDASRSMALADEEMPARRKFDSLKALGLTTKARDGAGNKELAEALTEFDALTRWQRAERLLLDPRDGLLTRLADGHDIDLILLRDRKAESVWRQRSGGEQTSVPIPVNWGTTPDHASTDLVTGIRAALGDTAENAAVVVVSDGQHNGRGTPEVLAAELGELGVPVFCVGLGSERPARDMVLREVNAPDTVFVDDIAQGAIVFLDSIPEGGRFRVEIKCGETILWEQVFAADGSGERRLEFAFPAREMAATVGEESRGNHPFALEANVFQADEGAGSRTPEATLANNGRRFFMQTISDRPGVLLIDGRPRWETRYLKNFFERAPRWEINALLRPLRPWDGDTWKRGAVPGTFPESRDELFRYDMIILGEVPRGAITDAEAAWIVEFVETRAGGLVFLDGARGHLTKLPTRELAALLPVARGEDKAIAVKGMRLTSEGMPLAALRFADGEDENARTWESLEPPRWSMPCEPLPGSAVLAEAVDGNGAASPALVHWRVGRGQVLYAAIDEFWRWRLGVGERYHERFWMQVAGWLSEPPYMVEDDHVSIASDRLVYDPGDLAELRVRLRDATGKFVDTAKLQAVLYEGRNERGSFDLEEDESGGGIYRGISGALASGSYELAIRERDGKEYPPRLRIEVREPPDLEMRQLHMNRDLLETMARRAGGKFFLEEDVAALPAELAQVDRKEIIASDLRLWSSWWWFLPIVALLTMEWTIRKRCGYV